jgi:EmrB/QacA subfamily drug resistance transporter
MGGKSNWIALFALSLATLVVGLDATVLNVALPTISGDLGASASQLQWIVNSYTLALAATILPAGVIADRYGRKRTLLVGLAIFFIGSIASALTSDANTLIAMRAVMGIGAAVITPIVMAMIPLMFDERERARAVGAIATSTSVGLPLGLIVGGYLLNHYSWSSIFWINVPIVILASIAVIALVQESQSPSTKRLDYLGAVLAIPGVVSLVYGFSEAPSYGWTSARTLGFIGAGLLLLAIFVFWEARAGEPLVPLQLFRHRAFVGGTISLALMMAVLYGLLFTLPQYLQEVRGNDALGTGVRLVPMMLGLMITATAGRSALAKFGVARVIAGGVLLIAAALAGLSFLTPHTGTIWIALALFAVGGGVGLAMTASMNSVLGALPRAEVGTGSAVTSTIRQVAAALGVAILGSILSSIYRGDLDRGMLQGLPPESARSVRESISAGMAAIAGRSDADALRAMIGGSYTDAMSTILLICAGVGVAVAAISLLLMRTPAGKPEPSPEPAGVVHLQELL